MKKIIIIAIVQITVIVFLAKYAYTNKNYIFQKIIFNPLNKAQYIFSSNNNLEYFYEPKANNVEQTSAWIPFKAQQTINSDSLNERNNYSYSKSDGVFRIITLGDSYTYGIYVDTENNWTELLEDKLNSGLKCKNIQKFEVINLGVPGYDIQYAIERYRIRGQKI